MEGWSNLLISIGSATAWLNVAAVGLTAILIAIEAMDAFLAVRAKRRARERLLSAAENDPELQRLVITARFEGLNAEDVEMAKTKVEYQIDKMSSEDRWVLQRALERNSPAGTKRFMMNVLPVKRVIVGKPTSLWRANVIERLDKLSKLDRNWNGYGAGPISFATADFALRLLEAICDFDAPPPQIVPGSSGDLQLEWHMAGTDIELHIEGPNNVHAWRSTPQSAEGESLDLTNDYAAVMGWILDLTERMSATASAAA